MTDSMFKSGSLALLILASVMLPVSGASIVLREQATHTGAVVFLGDIADIAAATEEEMHDLATTPLMAAPALGIQEFLHVAEVLELLEGRGVDVSDLSFAGARTVEIGEALQTTLPIAIESIRPLTAVEVEQAVSDAINAHLVDTTGHQEWEIEVTLNASLLRDLGKLGTELNASAGRSPWTGTQKFQIAGEAGQEPVLVLAKVNRLRNVVVTTRKIDQGSLIGAADIEMRLEGGNVPSAAVESLDLVIGKEAVRTIDANTVLQHSQMRSPLQVQRGETVKVFARTGGITVSTFAVVQQNGALGDLVQVQTLDKKERFAGRVSGWKQLEVLPTGATATDYAVLNQPETQKR
jgi:flagella basal body P-ring formation protein FlgA